MWSLKIGGLALATSIAATSNFIMLYTSLIRRIGDIGTQKIIDLFLRVVTAGLIMGGFSYAAGQLLQWLDKGILVNTTGIFIIICLSITVYILSCVLLGVDEMKEFIRWILRKR